MSTSRFMKRDAGLPDEAAAESFVGGVRFGFTGIGNRTWPMARLTLLREGVRIGPSVPWLSVLVPVWEARYEDLGEVQAVGTSRLTTSVRFISRDGRWAIFGTLERPRVLSSLTARGVAVGSDPVRFRFFFPTR